MATQKTAVKLVKINSGSDFMDGTTFHPDYELKVATLTYQNNNYSCMVAAGGSNFSGSLKTYVGDGIPPNCVRSSSAAASTLIGEYASVFDSSRNTVTTRVGQYVSGDTFYEYDRSISSNNSSWGVVKTTIGSWGSSASCVYAGGLTHVPSGVSHYRNVYGKPNDNSGARLIGFWENGEKKTTFQPQTESTSYDPSPYNRDATGIVAVFGLPFTVKFNANSGTGTKANQSLYYGISDYATQTLAANTTISPPDAYHVFNGWNTAANGSGVAISDGADADDVFEDVQLSAGGTVTLYAQWRFVGFSLSSVTKSAATLAGTLSLVNTSTGVTVATESNGTLSYAGEVGATYRIVCTVGTGADAYTMPAGISGLANDTFTPESGQTYSFEYSCPFYWVSLPAADSHGNVLGITTPSTYDAQITVNNATLPAYASGRSVTITATTDSEYSLESAILRDENGYSFATRSNITNDKFTETVNKSFSVEPTYGQKHYSVSIAKDAPSTSAFSSFSADASYVVANTSVTFSATVATGFSFEGFYLNGTKVDSADITESSDTYSFAHTVVESTAVVVKAKVSVKLSLSDSTLASLAITYGEDSQTPGTAFYVTLGDSFSYEVSVTAANKYFNGWYNADDVSHENPRSGFGDSKTVTPTAALDIYALIGDIDPSAPVTVTFAYANGTDATEGSFSVDGVPGPQVKTLSYDETVAPSVTLATLPENGFEFAGWFANADGMGDPIAVGDGGVLVVAYSRTIYALFVQNDHAICEWEGAETPKPMTWRSKTYESSKPFNPSACRVDARGYAGDGKGTVLALTVDMFSAPDAAATATARLTNIANQDARRLPVRRMERYMQVAVKANTEIDTLLVGTAMEGLAT